VLSWLLAALAGLLLCALAVHGSVARRRTRQLEKLLAVADDKLEQLQRQFERFVPADVVERLTDAADGFAPDRRQVTMLFADLRGFTALCDRLDPALTVDVLNGYFQRMTRAIKRHHGHVTEFVGDGLLALFGALEPNPWQQRDAVLSAQAMRAELADYNRQLLARGLPVLRFGIGIHGGEVVAGVIGTAGLSKFSVTGDPINVASRIEGLTRQFQVDLLISEEIRAALDDGFRLRPMPLARVKGKATPIQTYTIEPDPSVDAEAGQVATGAL
jgi:adenylate cyclase